MSTNGVFYLGYHVSASGGYMAMARRAESLGANTFAFFTRNPRGGAALKADEEAAAPFRAHWAAGKTALWWPTPLTLLTPAVTKGT